jgi:leucyl-tRNA synthetase
MQKKEYNPSENEKYWQEQWKVAKIFNFEIKGKTAYILDMFYYPSGKIHMGHIRNYSIGDVIARFYRLKGYNVLHPMGSDAFGMPAENAAIDNKVHPKDWTKANVEAMNSQIKKIGISYDWSREIATCDPSYYKHEQKMFIDFFKKNIAYQKKSFVNWDPVDCTVLANEQVVDGKGWRSGAVVEKKEMRQWFLKVSDYAEELLNSLDTLTGWPEKVKRMQKNWIGKSDGAEITFKTNNEKTITVFTTKPETIFGASFVAIAPNHEFSLALAAEKKQLQDFSFDNFIKESLAEKEIKEKNGIFTGHYCKNINGKDLPIFIANFVLLDYATGAIIGVPAHDERDLEFASKYEIGFIKVIEDEKIINSDFLNNLTQQDARNEIIAKLEEMHIGKRKTSYKLKDWGVSRQRYWGCPIPIIYCDKCGSVPVKEEDLPIKLPEDISFDGKGNPLERHPTWKNCKCPECGLDATKETDTLDTFFESSWYFLRFINPYLDSAFSKEEVKQLMPVDCYIGGIEHAILHLLYARFFMRALRDCNYLDNSITVEPFKTLLTQGMVCHATYKDSDNKWVEPSNIIKIFENGLETLRRKDNNLEVKRGLSEKMSKSKKNTVDPDEIIQIYGADTARLFMLSDTPYDKDIEWSDQGARAIFSYLKRISKLTDDFLTKKHPGVTEQTDDYNCQKMLNRTISEVTNHLEKFEFNVAIAKLRIFSNYLEDIIYNKDIKNIYNLLADCLKTFAIMISPFAPHLAETIWSKISQQSNYDSSSIFVCQAKWPSYDEKYLKEEFNTVALQLNGKLKYTFEISKDSKKDDYINKAKSLLKTNIDIKKIIVVEGKVVNFVF